MESISIGFLYHQTLLTQGSKGRMSAFGRCHPRPGEHSALRGVLKAAWNFGLQLECQLRTAQALQNATGKHCLKAQTG